MPCRTCSRGWQELELALNEITPQGAVAVAAAVAAKSSLRRLNLRENELEDEGAVIVAKVRLLVQCGVGFRVGGWREGSAALCSGRQPYVCTGTLSVAATAAAGGRSNGGRCDCRGRRPASLLSMLLRLVPMPGPR